MVLLGQMSASCTAPVCATLIYLYRYLPTQKCKADLILNDVALTAVRNWIRKEKICSKLFLSILLPFLEIKVISLWSKNMRQPMIEVYGEDVFAKLWEQWVEGMHTLYKANNGNICSELLKDIKCPTLILYGEKDPLVDAAQVSNLHMHIRGSRIHLYPDGKHNIHIYYAQDFNQRVQEFLLQP